jgi:hypothetical protein
MSIRRVGWLSAVLIPALALAGSANSFAHDKSCCPEKKQSCKACSLCAHHTKSCAVKCENPCPKTCAAKPCKLCSLCSKRCEKPCKVKCETTCATQTFYPVAYERPCRQSTCLSSYPVRTGSLVSYTEPVPAYVPPPAPITYGTTATTIDSGCGCARTSMP